jgi:hypothetical protein
MKQNGFIIINSTILDDPNDYIEFLGNVCVIVNCTVV